MAITTIDPKTALIVVDLQKGIVGRTLAHSVESVVKHAASLADAFRRHNLPVVLVNVTGGAPGRANETFKGTFPPDWSELIPEIKKQPQDHTVSKKTWGAFTNTDLEKYLKDNGVTQVVLAGIATSIGVESTARQAHELGFNVTLATDAMTDLSLDAHENSIARIFPRLGETGTTQDVLQQLN